MRGYLKHHGEAALDRRDGALEHLRGRVAVAKSDSAHPVLPGPVGVVVAHQFVDYPTGDARVLQPGRKGMAQVVRTVQVEVVEAPIWALLDRESAAKPPGRVVGKIPNFLGAETAADQLAALPAWEAARVVKANPDKAQRAVRATALTEGKVLYMAVPRLADELPFYLLDPEHLGMSPWEAATKEGAAKAGRKVAARELSSVDLVVCGSVAVNRRGARVGKGGGFSDLEVAFLVEAGVIRPDTVLTTTVHPLQVIDEPLPETIHDFRVDLIVTPDEAVWCAEPHRPPGILWEHLDEDKIAQVPALAALAARR